MSQEALTEKLNTDEYQKILDLRRVYGTAGVGVLIDVKNDLIELAMVRANGEQVIGYNKTDARKIRSGVRSYWKSWMGNYRGLTTKSSRDKKTLVSKERELK